MTNWRFVPIGDIKPNPNNPRIIKDDKFKKLVQSIKDFPEMLTLRPIVVNAEMVVLGGNMRLKACQAAGLREVPTILASGLTDERQREFIIKDNVGFGEWEWDTLANEWDADLLAEWGLDVPEFEKAPADGLTDPDEVPEAPAYPVSVLGDLWILGNHRVLCGDSTSVDAVERLMDGGSANMVFTDPPYNVAFNGRSGKFDVIKNDNISEDDFEQLIADTAAMIQMLNPSHYYVWCNWKFYATLQTKLPFKGCIVWAKNVFGLGKGYRHQHEFCLYNATLTENITSESDLWSVSKDTAYMHPTQKPVELALRALQNHQDCQTIVDLFGGSGSTLIACERQGRHAYLMELDPKYVDVIVKRWQDFTGKDAIHSVTGETFNSMASSNGRTANG